MALLGGGGAKTYAKKTNWLVFHRSHFYSRIDIKAERDHYHATPSVKREDLF